MSPLRNRTFGEKVTLDIDKLDGLRMGSGDSIMRIRGWDEYHFAGQVEGILRADGRELWEGVVIEPSELSRLFEPYDDPTTEVPRTIARRSGDYGRPKRAGYIRLDTKDAREYSLTLTSSGEVRMRDIACLSGGIPESLDLEVYFRDQRRVYSLYQSTLHGQKVQKILADTIG